jgi:protein-S-isoprenylcysteine O-methyltransferase Ste14
MRQIYDFKHFLYPTNFRHYSDGGLLLTSFGVAGLTDSASRAALTVLLIPLLHQKARNEERTLLEVYGPLYEEYSREVPSTVVPFVDVEIL